jgi:murein DD-endopeptidase MepM/ murein hydrolase activator NlpD
MKPIVLLWLLSIFSTLTTPAFADDRFLRPGDLIPGSGQGVTGTDVFYPGMRFPIEQAPAFAGSQLYGVGGLKGRDGDSCDDANYTYPWRDNFCELRKTDLAMCASGGHQGQDLRPATCRANYYWAVAAEDGVIAQVGRFGVTLQTASGTLYRYVHLNTSDLAVHEMQKVSRGDRIGKISNNWVDRLPIHLHFDIKDAVKIGEREEVVFMPPYTSLVQSYKTLLEQSNPTEARKD